MLKKLILPFAVMMGSTTAYAAEVYNGDDEYYEVYPEGQAASPTQLRNNLSVSRVGFISSADGNLTTDEAVGFSVMGENYNANNLGFLWRLNILGDSQEEGVVEQETLVFDYSIGIGYGLPLNKLNIATGISALDNASILVKGHYGFDWQVITNTVGGDEVETSLLATYMKYGAGLRLPILEFWDLEVMLENTNVGDYSVEADGEDLGDIEAPDSGAGISIASNFYFSANKDFGIGIELSTGVHDYTTLSLSSRF